VNVMVWKASLDRLATRPNLMARGVLLPSSDCPFCDLEAEGFDHVLVKCHRASGVWIKVWSWWNLPRLFSFPSFSFVEVAKGSVNVPAVPSTKLDWIQSLNLLMASGSHSGPYGISGNIKFWDTRSGDLVSEIKEKVDCFSDITDSDSLSAVFKIGMNSPEVSYIDFRNLSSDGSWNCLGDSRKLVNVKKGVWLQD
nr:BTB/POZ fold [Tanacetum cinerariifolium]